MNNTNDISNKPEFIHELANITGYTVGDTTRFVDAFIALFENCILNERKINVRGFGKLYYVSLPERKGFKPIRGIIGGGETQIYPAVKKVIFKLAKNLRDLLKYEEFDELDDI